MTKVKPSPLSILGLVGLLLATPLCIYNLFRTKEPSPEFLGTEVPYYTNFARFTLLIRCQDPIEAWSRTEVFSNGSWPAIQLGSPMADSFERQWIESGKQWSLKVPIPEPKARWRLRLSITPINPMKSKASTLAYTIGVPYHPSYEGFDFFSEEFQGTNVLSRIDEH